MRHFAYFILFFLILLNDVVLAGNNSGAAFSIWPDTGQTKCYNDTVEIPCPAQGDPFYGQDAQHNGPPRSYTLLGGGTMVQDNVTGLIWEMKDSMDGNPDYNNPNDADNIYTWCETNPATNGGDQGTCGDNDTQDFIDQLNSGSGFGGYTDWRMPTIKELATLFNHGRHNPAIDPVYATTSSDYYWSSTTDVHLPVYTWTGDFYFGWVLAIKKSSAYYVRAVRGGQPPSADRYVDNNDGTVTDTVTCLQWQKAAMDTKDGVGPDTYNWQEALAVSENLTLAGHSDWRLPDKNELSSLFDYSRDFPAIDPVFPATSSNHLSNHFWSSTTAATNSAYTWIGDFSAGFVDPGKKLSAYYVRAVRDGQCGSPLAPVASFSATPVSGTAPLQVSFNDLSTGTISSWAWDFDNNGSTDSTLQNPSYIYSSAGTYSVKLMVTGPGGSNVKTTMNYINVSGAIADSDGDGIPDWWEEQYFPGNLNALSKNGDYDMDGYSDYQEYLNGYNPKVENEPGGPGYLIPGSSALPAIFTLLLKAKEGEVITTLQPGPAE